MHESQLAGLRHVLSTRSSKRAILLAFMHERQHEGCPRWFLVVLAFMHESLLACMPGALAKALQPPRFNPARLLQRSGCIIPESWKACCPAVLLAGIPAFMHEYMQAITRDLRAPRRGRGVVASGVDNTPMGEKPPERAGFGPLNFMHA
jgi:hypothetical protein